jgi:hypothetical protein
VLLKSTAGVTLSNPNITVHVVVTSVPVDVTVNPHQHIEQLIREALRKAEQGASDIAGWELKTVGGDLLAPGERISDRVSNGDKLFLNKNAGGGGACR